MLTKLQGKWRLRIGSAAMFWTILALVLGIGWYLALRQESREVRWFFAWHFAQPALYMVPLAILLRNLYGTNVHAWFVTVPAFLFVAYGFIINVGIHYVG